MRINKACCSFACYITNKLCQVHKSSFEVPGISQIKNMFLFLFCLAVTGSLAEIPLFGPVERRTCIRERYYFATNALYRNFEKAKRNCDYYRCDIIVKYEAGMEYQDWFWPRLCGFLGRSRPGIPGSSHSRLFGRFEFGFLELNER